MNKRSIILTSILGFLILSAGTLLAQPTTNPIFVNPLASSTGTSSFDQMLTRVLSWLFPFSLAAAVLMILIGAYYMVLSGGNPQKIATGKKIVIYALVGVAIVTISRGIVALLRVILGL